MHIEVRPAGLTDWYHYAAPSIRQDYGLFSLMSDIRRNSGIAPVVQPKGLPHDLSLVTRLCFAVDAERYPPHGASWLGRDEITDLREAWAALVRSRGGNPYDLNHDLECGIFHTYMCGNEIEGIDGTPFEDVRLVFWFDN